MNTRNGGRGVSRDRIFTLAALSGSTLTAVTGMAQGPVGEQVVSGSADFSRAGSLTQITTGQTAIINYQSFNVAAGHTVQFIQPNAQSRVLNRVLGPDPSQIAGTIQANGQVYLVNPAGITFYNGSVINVGQLYAAAGSITNGDFLSGVDRFTELRGTVRNQGLIQASKAVLAGAKVENLGSVNAPGGTVVFTAGDSVFIGQNGSSLYARVSGGAAANGIDNSGSVNAAGGTVIAATGDIFGMAIRQSGNIKAASVAIQGGAGTYTSVSGTIDASNTAGSGGAVKVLGGTVAVLDGHIDASGSAGGGQVLVGGNWQGQGPELNAQNTFVSQGSTINADATAAGDGGTIAVWSDQNTAFYGSASAVGTGQNGNGGRIETSGKIWLDVAGARIAARGDEARGGKGGLWLLDPTDITINNAATNPGAIFNAATGAFTAQAVNTANILVTDIRTALESGFDVTISSSSGGAGPGGGDITFANSLSVALGGTRTLTLLANGSANAAISFSAGVSVVSVGAALNVILTANDTVTLANNTFNLLNGDLTITSNNGVSIGAAVFQNINAWSASASLPNVITLTGSPTFSTGITSISFGRDVAGGGNALAFAAGAGTTSFSGSVTNVTSLDNQRTGAVSIGGDQTATTGAIRHAGAVTLTGDRIFTTTNQAVTFDQTVNFGVASALTVAAGTGTVTFGGAVTNATSIQRTGSGLTRIAASQTGTNILSYGGAVELSGGDVTLSGTSVTISGNITDTAAASNLVLTGSGGGSLAVNGTSVTLASLTTNGVAFSATNLATMTVTGATGVVINAGGTVQGAIDTSANNGPFNVTAGTLTIDGDTIITTGNGPVSFAGAVTSTAGTEDLTISAGSGTVTFSGTLNTIGDVILTAGSGATTFNGTVGATSLASLTNNRTGLVTIAANQTSAGALVHSGSVGGISLTGDRALSAGAALTLTGAVAGTGGNSLTLNGAGTTTTFGSTVSALGFLSNNRTGVTNIGGNQTISTTLLYNSGLNLTASAILDAGDVITITGSVTGNGNNLDFAAQPANTVFGSTVSNVGRLQNLRTGTTSIGGNQNTTLGAGALIQHAGNVTLTANTEFNAGAGATTFGGTVNGAFNFDLIGSGTTSFGAAVGNSTPVARLLNQRSGAITIAGNQTTAGGATGALTHVGDVTLTGGGTLVFDSGVGAMTFGNVSGGGTTGLTLNQASNNGANNPGDTFLNGTLTALATFTNNRTGNTTIGGNINIPGAFANAGPLVFSTASTVIQAGSINLGGNLSTTANTNLVLNSVGATTLGGTLITLGSLSTDVAGGPFAFVNGGGAANTFTLPAAVGRIATLNQGTGFVLNDQGVRTVGGQINTSPGNGPVNFAGTAGIVLNADTIINAGSGAVTFAGPVSGAFNLDLLGSGTTAFNAVTSVARIDNRRTGAITFANNQTATGLIRHDGPVTLLTGAAITAASITFNSTIDASAAGVEGLQLFAPGATLIAGNVGQTVALGVFASDAPGSLTVGSIKTRGNIIASDATVNLTGATYDSTDAGAFANGAPITFNSAFNDLTTLALNTSVTSGIFATNFRGAVRSAGANVSLATTSAGGTFGNHIGGTAGDPDAFRLLSLSVTSPLGGTAITFGDASVTDMSVRTIGNIAGAININADSLLASNLTLDTRVPGNTSANIVFAGSINSTGGTPRDLTLLNQGLVDLQGTIGNLGGNARLRNILSDAAFTALNGTINIEENTDVTGSIILNDGTSTVVLGDGGASDIVTINAPGGFIVTGAQTIIADDVTINATAANIVFGNVNTGDPVADAISNDLATVNADVADTRNFTVTTTGTKTFRGQIGFGAGGRLASFISSGAGTITVEEGINTTGLQSFQDATLTFGDGGGSTPPLDGEVITFSTTTGNFLVLSGATTIADDIVITSTGSGNITFGGVGNDSATINADTTGRDFTINTSGTAEFRGTIGNFVALETITSDTGGTVIFEENVTTRGNIQLNDTTLIALGDSGASDPVAITTTNGGSFQVTSGPTELRDDITINTGAAAITFGAAAPGDTATINSDAALTPRALVFTSTGTKLVRGQIGNSFALLSLTSNGAGTITLEENTTTQGAIDLFDATVTLGDNGADDTVTFSTLGNATTGADFLVRSGATIIADDVTITTGTGAITFGVAAPGDGSTINADAGVLTRDLTLTTTSGVKTLRGAVGNADRLSSLTTNGAGLAILEENVTTVNAITLNGGPIQLGDGDGTAEPVAYTTTNSLFQITTGPTTLSDNITISTGSGNVTVNGLVDADNFSNDRTLAIESSGAVNFTGAIGSAQAPLSVTSDVLGSSRFVNITTRGTSGTGAGIFLLDPTVTLAGTTYDTTRGGADTPAAGTTYFRINNARGELAQLDNDVTVTTAAGNVIFEGRVESITANRDLSINTGFNIPTGDVTFADNVGGTDQAGTDRLDVLTVGSANGRANRIVFGTNLLAAGDSPLPSGTARFVSTVNNQSFFSSITDDTLGTLIGADTTFRSSLGNIRFDTFVNADRRDLTRDLVVLAPAAGPNGVITFVVDTGFRGSAGAADNGSFETVTLNTAGASGSQINVFGVRSFLDQDYNASIIALQGASYIANDTDPGTSEPGFGTITFGDTTIANPQSVILSRAADADIANRTVTVTAGQNIFFNTTINSAGETANVIGSLTTNLTTRDPQPDFRTRFGASIGAGNTSGPSTTTAARLERLISNGPAGTFTQFGGLAAPLTSPDDLFVLTRGAGTQIYNNAVRLSTDVVYGDNLAGDINFNSTIDSASASDPPVLEQGTRSIAVRTRGVTRFRGSVGDAGALNQVVTDGIYTGYSGGALDANEIGTNPGGPQNRVVFGASTFDAADVIVRTTLGQTYNDPDGIRLGASTTFRADTGNILVNTTINADTNQRLNASSVLVNVFRDLTITTGGRVTLNGSIGDGDNYTAAGDALSESGTTPDPLPDNFFQAAPASADAANIRPNNIRISGNDFATGIGTALAGSALQFGTSQPNGTLRFVRSRGTQRYDYTQSTNGIVLQQDMVFSSNNSVATPAAGTNNITFNGAIVSDTAAVAASNTGRRLTVNTAGATAFNGFVGGTAGAGTINTNRLLVLTTDARDFDPANQLNGTRGAEFGGTTQFGNSVFLAGQNIDGAGNFFINQAAVGGVSAAVQYRRLSGLVVNDAAIINPVAAAANVVTIDAGSSSIWFRQGITNAGAAATRLSFVSAADSLLVGGEDRLTANSFQALSAANRLAYIRGYLAPIALGGDIGTDGARFGAVTFNTLNPTAAPNTDARFANNAIRGDALSGSNVPILSTILFANLSGAYNGSIRLADQFAGAVPTDNQALNRLYTDDAVTGNATTNLAGNTTLANSGNLGSLASATNNTFRIFTSGSASGQGITFAQNEKVTAFGNFELRSGTLLNAGNIIIGDINSAGLAGGTAGNLFVGESLTANIAVVQRQASRIARFFDFDLFAVNDQGVDYLAANSITFSRLPIRAGAITTFDGGLRPQFATVSGDNVVLEGDVLPPFTIRRYRNPMYTGPLTPDDRGTEANQYNDDARVVDGGIVERLIPFDLRAEGASIIVYSDSENTILEAVRDLPFEPTVRRHNREPWFRAERAPSRLIEEDVIRTIRTGHSGLTPAVQPAASNGQAAAPAAGQPAPATGR